MLKLVHAFDMNFDSVKDYYNSFEDKWFDLNCYAISCVENGFKAYFDEVSMYDPNLYYLITICTVWLITIGHLFL